MDDHVMPHALDKTYVIDVNKELLVFPFSGDVMNFSPAADKYILRVRIVNYPH